MLRVILALLLMLCCVRVASAQTTQPAAGWVCTSARFYPLVDWLTYEMTGPGQVYQPTSTVRHWVTEAVPGLSAVTCRRTRNNNTYNLDVLATISWNGSFSNPTLTVVGDGRTFVEAYITVQSDVKITVHGLSNDGAESGSQSIGTMEFTWVGEGGGGGSLDLSGDAGPTTVPVHHQLGDFGAYGTSSVVRMPDLAELQRGEVEDIAFQPDASFPTEELSFSMPFGVAIAGYNPQMASIDFSQAKSSVQGPLDVANAILKACLVFASAYWVMEEFKRT